MQEDILKPNLTAPHFSPSTKKNKCVIQGRPDMSNFPQVLRNGELRGIRYHSYLKIFYKSINLVQTSYKVGSFQIKNAFLMIHGQSRTPIESRRRSSSKSSFSCRRNEMYRSFSTNMYVLLTYYSTSLPRIIEAEPSL